MLYLMMKIIMPNCIFILSINSQIIFYFQIYLIHLVYKSTSQLDFAVEQMSCRTDPLDAPDFIAVTTVNLKKYQTWFQIAWNLCTVNSVYVLG